MKYITVDEQERLYKFRQWKDLQRSLIGKIAIIDIIMKKYGIDKSEVLFQKNDYGKPYFTKEENFHFNISHSGDWIVCITDVESVGIDVEKVSDIDFGIAKRFFAKEEYEYFLKQKEEDKLSYFYDLWTLKESYIKAVGMGLSLPLESFAIIKEGDNISIKGAKKDYYFKQYVLPDYKLSVCSLNTNFPSLVKFKTVSDYSVL